VLIPKKFKISGKTFTVKVIDTMPRPRRMGEFNATLCAIDIGTKSNVTGRVFKTEEVSDTFWHEVTHAILHDMGHPLWSNEKFVTRFANRLNEVVNTAKL
jgi:hypothetical protein